MAQPPTCSTNRTPNRFTFRQNYDLSTAAWEVIHRQGPDADRSSRMADLGAKALSVLRFHAPPRSLRPICEGSLRRLEPDGRMFSSTRCRN